MIRVDLQSALAALRPADRSDIVAHRGVVAAATREEAHLLDTGGVRIDDVLLPGSAGVKLRVRRYRPATRAWSGSSKAGVLWMHGGGFCTGLPEACDRIAVDIVRALGVVVLSPDYRLAPEFPFPAAFEDCLRALNWMTSSVGLGLSRIAVGGASAGGGLAAALALHARDTGDPSVALQVLLYPPLDDREDDGADQDRYADVPVFNRQDARLMWQRYLPSGGPVSHYAAPGRAKDLSGVAPAYLLLADNDPLRDQGLEYGRRLMAAGVATELHHFPGTFHGFDAIAPDAPVTQEVVQSYLAALRAAVPV